MSGSSRPIVAIGPVLGALAFTIYMKTDWGISLFFLTPLALVAIPALRIRGNRAVSFDRDLARDHARSVLAASPYIAAREMAVNPNGASTFGARSELARELTQAWRTRFHSRWAVVAGTTEMGQPLTFYSPDHPAPLTPGEFWSSGLTSLEEARRLGFIGVCDTTDGRLPICEAWMDGECRGRRASHHHHAALLQGPSGTGDHLEGFYRAAGEVEQAVIPGDAKHRASESEAIPGLVLRHHPGMTVLLRRLLR